MLNFNISEKGLGLATDQTSMSDCHYFSRYRDICVLQLFVNQAVTSSYLKLTSSFLLSRFTT